ncbi:MAG TPA: hypothetical protein VMG12_41150, partial [Polyangiaceae bacterium]|nr:hypothetical protein [Polyangiaceae bacterium]
MSSTSSFLPSISASPAEREPDRRRALGRRTALPRPGALVALASLAFAFGCGSDRTDVDQGSSGSAGQVGNGGSSGNGNGGSSGSGTAGSAGTAGNGGSAGNGGGSNVPDNCQLPGDAFAWPAPASVDVPAHESWKSQLELPNDAFFSLPQGDFLEEVRWVKFIVLASDPSQIYFQDATAYPFHYEFARDHVPAFEGMTRAEFDAVTLRNEGREAVLGAVLVPSDSSSHPEYGVQLVSNDDLHPALVDDVLATVAAHVTAPAGTSEYYFPSGTSAT